MQLVSGKIFDKKGEKRIIASIALCLLLILTLHGYVSTMVTFFDPAQSERLNDSFLRASAYSSGGGGGGGSSTTFPPSAGAVDILTPQQAYDRLKEYTPKQIAEVLNDVDEISHIAAILNLFKTSDIIDIIKEMTPRVSSNVLLIIDIDISAEVIAELDETNLDIIKEMINSDLNESAIRIEETVKLLIKDLDESERSAALEKLSSTLIELSAESLVELFIEISNLPQTPSTVAYLLESMTLTNSLNITETWVELGDLSTLGNVINYLSTESLTDLYRGLLSNTQETIYPYLLPETIETLPSLGEFKIFELTATPSEISLGNSVDISFELMNIGNDSDAYTVVLTINGDNKESYNGFMINGSSESFTYSMIADEVGEYNVMILEETTTFIVAQPTSPLTPAQIVIDSIVVLPEEILSGGELSVLVTISNEGDLPGIKFVELKIDNIPIDIKETQILGGRTETLFFDIVEDFTPGIHFVSIDDKTESFTVASPPKNLPWSTIIVTVIVVLGGVVYILNERGIIKLPINILSLVTKSPIIP